MSLYRKAESYVSHEKSGRPIFRWNTIKDGRIVRLIYVDEAGTSPKEPVRVVAGLIVHGDDQVRQLSGDLERIFDERVPKHIRENFIFHGLEVFSGGKTIKRDEWPFEDRLDFFKEVLCLPYVNDIPIALGVVFKDAFKLSEDLNALLSENRIGLQTYEHGVAFGYCLDKADLFLQKYLDGKEIGSVVAEDVPVNKKVLGKMAMIYKDNKVELKSEHQIQTDTEKVLGLFPEPYVYNISNIVDVPHFVEKGGAPILQLADACAFAVRRCLSKQEHGRDLCLAMLGQAQGASLVNEPAWFTGSSSGLYNTEAYWSDQEKQRHKDANLKLKILRSLNTNLTDDPNQTLIIVDGESVREL